MEAQLDSSIGWKEGVKMAKKVNDIQADFCLVWSEQWCSILDSNINTLTKVSPPTPKYLQNYTTDFHEVFGVKLYAPKDKNVKIFM